MDGLESLFSPSMMGTANAILRAFNNRKYIFFVTLMLDQAKLKAVEEKKKEEQGGNCSICMILSRITPFPPLPCFKAMIPKFIVQWTKQLRIGLNVNNF